MGDTAVPGWRGLLLDVGRMDAAVEPDRMYSRRSLEKNLPDWKSGIGNHPIVN